ncbi:MAG: hypothetical protein AABY64_09190 [Bdellovibrionota bacterium]
MTQKSVKKEISFSRTDNLAWPDFWTAFDKISDRLKLPRIENVVIKFTGSDVSFETVRAEKNATQQLILPFPEVLIYTNAELEIYIASALASYYRVNTHYIVKDEVLAAMYTPDSVMKVFLSYMTGDYHSPMRLVKDFNKLSNRNMQQLARLMLADMAPQRKKIIDKIRALSKISEEDKPILSDLVNNTANDWSRTLFMQKQFQSLMFSVLDSSDRIPEDIYKCGEYFQFPIVDINSISSVPSEFFKPMQVGLNEIFKSYGLTTAEVIVYFYFDSVPEYYILSKTRGEFVLPFPLIFFYTADELKILYEMMALNLLRYNEPKAYLKIVETLSKRHKFAWTAMRVKEAYYSKKFRLFHDACEYGNLNEAEFLKQHEELKAWMLEPKELILKDLAQEFFPNLSNSDFNAIVELTMQTRLSNQICENFKIVEDMLLKISFKKSILKKRVA